MKKLTLVILFCLTASLSVLSQEREKIPLVDPAFRGMSFHVDIASPILGLLVAPNTTNIEALVDVNLYDRFFPIFEVGYSSIHKNINESMFSTQAPFFRFGMNFNIIRTADKKGVYKENRNYAYLGVRYGFSMLAYEVGNVMIENPYWGTSYPKDYRNPFAYVGWAELHGGVRINMIKGFTMSWSVGLRMLKHTSENQKQMLWYVPGYGRDNAMNFSFKYTLGYTFRTAKAKELTGRKITTFEP